MSAGRDSGRSAFSTFSVVIDDGCVVGCCSSVTAADIVVEGVGVGTAAIGEDSDWLRERVRVRLTMEEKPLAACSLA